MARRAPADNVLPNQFQTVAAVLPSDWAEKHKRFSAQSEGRTGGERLELVWYKDIVLRGSSRRSLQFFLPYFSASLEFPSPPLSAPGSPRMLITLN